MQKVSAGQVRVPGVHPPAPANLPPGFALGAHGIPGMQVAARCRPARLAPGAGGDFFDIFRLHRNRWGLVVGDVAGRGSSAALLAAVARSRLRAAAAQHAEPSDVLRDVNGVMLAGGDADEQFSSAVFARLELDVCGAWVTLACGGAPQPIVVRRAGWIDVRGQLGTLLGAFSEPELADDRVGLGPGDALVFCSDGVTGAAGASGELFCDERLPSVLLANHHSDAEQLADRVLGELSVYRRGPQRDDAAVLVVRVPEEDETDAQGRLQSATASGEDELPLPGYPVGEPYWGRHDRPAPPREARLQLSPDPSFVGVSRHFVNGLLHSWRMSELTDGDVELLTSEVVTNALRHTDSPLTVIVRYDGQHIRVEVGDGSRALPQRVRPGIEALGGRGMDIVAIVSQAWGVTPTVDGKRVWFEVAAA